MIIETTGYDIELEDEIRLGETFYISIDESFDLHHIEDENGVELDAGEFNVEWAIAFVENELGLLKEEAKLERQAQLAEVDL